MIFHELSSLDGDKQWALLIDTSTHNGQFLAYDQEQSLFDKIWGRESKHDQIINDLFEDLKKELQLQDLNKIICVYGPGSFTGLRVSATFSKILSLSLKDVPIYGLSSFHIYAHGIVENNLIEKGHDFEVFMSSIGDKSFKSSFKFDKDSGFYNEEIDLSGSTEHEIIKPNQFLISNLESESFFKMRHSSLSEKSIVRPHIRKFSYLDFYPLFLRRSEAEEKLKI